jgi:uncharacterized protein
MPSPSRHLKRLRRELLLLDEETMLIEELDGFIAGLVVCPDLIKPGEWLPVVWNRDDGDEQPVFENLDHANRVLGLVMEHYNGIVRALMDRPKRYAPLFPVDERNGDVIWEIWVEGFERAVKLRPAAWQKLLSADDDVAAAMRGMLRLVEAVADEQRLPPEEREALTATAPENIARWITTLNAWRLANHPPMQDIAPMPPQPFAAAKKTGRNDPCPCGSGKKYKRCCGLH